MGKLNIAKDEFVALKLPLGLSYPWHMENAMPGVYSFCLSFVRDMTKPTMWLCSQRRLRSAWASAQSDQSLHCPHEESLGP